MGHSLDAQCEDWLETSDLVEKLQSRIESSRVQDPAVSQAELLKVLSASVPIKLAGETDTGQLAEEQDRENEAIPRT